VFDNPLSDDIQVRFRAINDYAGKNGFVGGFPNFFETNTDCPEKRANLRNKLGVIRGN
jgi:hypothetical protein